ncbi:MAG: cytochrome b/b6 domain-containing protein [Chromatiales bacterium]|nr:cytochrome b/b6 domain-containing protein [Chromatiales bacterium]
MAEPLDTADRFVRVQVWPASLRLIHWIIAAGLVFQIASAWLVNYAAVDAHHWRDWHLIVGQVLVAALVLRIVVAFRSGPSSWRALWPGRAQRAAIPAMLRFYLSLGRAPLPNWYAHNPLWAPLYALTWLILGLALISGLGHDSSPILGMSLAHVHATSAAVLAVITIAHIATVILHDWRGGAASISGMLSGERYFRSTSIRPPPDKNAGFEVSLASLRANRNQQTGDADDLR